MAYKKTSTKKKKKPVGSKAGQAALGSAKGKSAAQIAYEKKLRQPARSPKKKKLPPKKKWTPPKKSRNLAKRRKK